MVADKRHASIRRAGRLKLNTRSTYNTSMSPARRLVKMRTRDEPDSSPRTNRSRPFWSSTARNVAIFPAVGNALQSFFSYCLAVGYAFPILFVDSLWWSLLFYFFSSECPCCWECSPISSWFHGIDACRSCCDLLIHWRNCTDLGRSWCGALHHRRRFCDQAGAKYYTDEARAAITAGASVRYFTGVEGAAITAGAGATRSPSRQLA